MRVRRQLAFVVALSMVSVALGLVLPAVTGCAPAGQVASEQLSAASLRVPNRGLYGFDGTTNIEADKTAVSSFLIDAKVARERYFRGTTLSASDYREIVAAGVDEICREDAKAPFDEVYILGYSRGAVAALEVAARVESECARPIPVRWLGLIDAVATSVEESLRIGNAGRTAFTTRCTHVVKSHEKPERLLVLGTAAVLSCDVKKLQADHAGVARLPQTLEHLKADVRSVAPDLFGGAAVNQCAEATELLACLAKGCSWLNAACMAIKR